MIHREPNHHNPIGSSLPPLKLINAQPFTDFGPMGINLLHEIANPLTSAILALEEFRSRPGSDLLDQLQDSIGTIEHTLRSARDHMASDEPGTFNINQEILEVKDELIQKAPNSDLQLIVHGTANIKLAGDADKFKLIISNLLTNSMQAYQNNPDTKCEIVITILTNANTVTLLCTDWAGGMSEYQVDRAFDAFFSTKPKLGSNLGLGLFIVKQFVEQDFNGTISIDSTPGEGTIFSMTFPQVRALAVTT